MLIIRGNGSYLYIENNKHQYDKTNWNFEDDN